MNVTVPALQEGVCGSLKVSTAVVALVSVSTLTHSRLTSRAVCPPATSVNVMGFCMTKLGSLMADIVAVPAQVPANCAGMVGPAACAVAGVAVFGWPAGGVLRVSVTAPPVDS